MSVIISYKRNDTVYMGTDTRVIVGDEKRNELCECDYKILKLENGLLVGLDASKDIRQILYAYSEIFTLDKRGKLTKKHIVKEIIPKLIRLLDGENLLTKEEKEFPYLNATITLAHEGELYEICKGFCVYKYEDFQILGDVSGYGMYTLASMKPTDDVNDKIVKALDIIAKHSQLVGAPYLLIDTKEKQYKLVGGNNV